MYSSSFRVKCALSVAGVLILFVAGCGAAEKNSSKLESGEPVLDSAPYSLAPIQDELTIAELFAEIETAPAPVELLSERFELLKGELVKRLLETGRQRFAKAVPSGGAGKVTDLEYAPESRMLTWTYKNLGDYDGSGEVGISDITPIALKCLARTNDGAGNDAEEAWIDGDENGEVRISDITPIAQNYLAEVKGYRIITSISQTSDFKVIGQALYPHNAMAGFPIRLSIEIPEGAQLYVWVQPYDSSGKTGQMSNSVICAEIEDPPVINSVSPLSGGDGEEVQFSAEVSGGQTYATYTWNFGGGATPNISIEVSPTVLLGPSGVHSASLTVTNTGGSDVFEFEYEVGPKPPEIDSVMPLSGLKSQPVTFEAAVTGSAPMTYVWNFGGGALPNTSSDESPEVALSSVKGVYSANLTVSNAYGNAEFPFELIVSGQPPVAKCSATPVGGTPPLSVTLRSSGSFDPDGTIVKYEWDFDDGAGFQDFTSTNGLANKTFTSTGYYDAVLRVTDNEEDFATAQVQIQVFSLPPGSWQKTKVDTNSGINCFNGSIDVTNDGKPWMVYRLVKTLESELKLAHYNGNMWIYDKPEAVAGGTSYRYSSVKVSSTGDPYVYYASGFPDQAVKLSWKSGGYWYHSVIAEPIYCYTGIMFDLDSTDTPHLAYKDTGDLYYVTKSGTDWDIQHFAHGGDPFLVVGPGGNPHVLYPGLYGHYYYTFWNGTAWITEYLNDFSDGNGLEFGTLAIDSNGNPHMSFGYNTIFYMHKNASGWQFQLIPLSQSSSDAWIAVDSQNAPCISFAMAVGGTGRHVYYMRKNSEGMWAWRPVQESGYNNQTRLAIDSSNRAHISFYNETLKEVWYAKWIPG